MRLASKIFLASSLVIVVVAGVGVLSLRAVARLVSVNREITTQTVPALRLSGNLRDELLSLARIEARWAVLRDRRYERLWVEAAARADTDLVRLRDLIRTDREGRLLAETHRMFALYRASVMEQQTRAGVPGIDSPSRALADRVESALDALTDVTHARVAAAQGEAIRLESRTWTGVIVALVAASGLALLSTAFIALRMTRSLRHLSEATAAVAAGSFQDPIPAETRDEIGALAHSFNAMAAQLRRMDDTKAEFFARLSHELRSPLTSVREASQLLRDQVPGPLNAKQTRLIDIMSTSTDRLLRLVNQMLEMSRLRAGVLPLERRRLDLKRVVTRAVEEMRPQAVEAGVHLERECVGDHFAYAGDEERLLQVVVNLLNNAVKFTPRGGHVTARVVHAGSEIEIQVEDTGIGIPAAELPYVFDSYRQAHRGHGGTGLGLAIVRGLVQAHGGRVTVESQEGKGSRFTVLLPRREGAS